VFRLEGPELKATMVRLGMPIGREPVWSADDSFSIMTKPAASP
jgi:hypothetical protein